LIEKYGAPIPKKKLHTKVTNEPLLPQTPEEVKALAQAMADAVTEEILNEATKPLCIHALGLVVAKATLKPGEVLEFVNLPKVIETPVNGMDFVLGAQVSLPDGTVELRPVAIPFVYVKATCTKGWNATVTKHHITYEDAQKKLDASKVKPKAKPGGSLKKKLQGKKKPNPITGVFQKADEPTSSGNVYPAHLFDKLVSVQPMKIPTGLLEHPGWGKTYQPYPWQQEWAASLSHEDSINADALQNLIPPVDPFPILSCYDKVVSVAIKKGNTEINELPKLKATTPLLNPPHATCLRYVVGPKIAAAFTSRIAFRVHTHDHKVYQWDMDFGSDIFETLMSVKADADDWAKHLAQAALQSKPEIFGPWYCILVRVLCDYYAQATAKGKGAVYVQGVYSRKFTGEKP
jgi:hypothetical protein